MGAVPDVEIPGLEARVTIWDLDRGAIVTTSSGIDPSKFLAFSRDGAQIVTASEGGTDVWDTRTGEQLAELPQRFNDIAFSPDGTSFAGALADATVRLYDAVSFEERLILRGLAETASWVDFSRDGSMLVSGGGQGKVRVWALDIADLLEIARQKVTRSLTDEECRQYLHQEPCPA
jgi:WD40 repeat protein